MASFLEIPVELRLIIYKHYFKDTLDTPPLIDDYEATKYTANSLLENIKLYNMHSNILQASRKNMTETIPIYREGLAALVKTSQETRQLLQKQYFASDFPDCQTDNLIWVLCLTIERLQKLSETLGHVEKMLASHSELQGRFGQC
jgi:hypothetical protein